MSFTSNLPLYSQKFPHLRFSVKIRLVLHTGTLKWLIIYIYIFLWGLRGEIVSSTLKLIFQIVY